MPGSCLRAEQSIIHSVVRAGGIIVTSTLEKGIEAWSTKRISIASSLWGLIGGLS